ncbi:hypothetical protein MHZ92_07170 [Sporosarcina sp. ACRSL]|uniref:hypothetical protein n=1 Tax=Sporosarcina sp. ACRSL TaxID=2918215 RepID=UPI001EF479BF|nr:hypothetical protein [Sporosarcina sp. ACRSL]MCG7343907.1 hypothetical protein [Sporosarcina sp. ACRSL]
MDWGYLGRVCVHGLFILREFGPVMRDFGGVMIEFLRIMSEFKGVMRMLEQVLLISGPSSHHKAARKKFI